MNELLPIDDLHETLLRDVIREISTEDDALLWMTLIHTYAITLTQAIAKETPGVTRFVPLTQRGAADVVAKLWKDQGSAEAHYMHWYFVWNTRHAYEAAADIPPALLAQLEERRQLLLSHPLVVSVDSDD